MSRKRGDKRKGSALTEDKIIAQRVEAMERVQRRMKTMLSELGTSEKIQAQVTGKWRSILRETRADELRGEIWEYSKTFQRALESTKGITTSLTQDLNKGVEQAARPQQMKQRFMDRLLRQEQLDTESDWEEKTFDDFSAESGCKWDAITRREEEDYVKHVALADELQSSERSSKVALDYHIVCEEVKQQYREKTYANYVDLKDTIQELVDKFPAKQMRYERDIPVSFECSERVLHKTKDAITALRNQMSSESENEATLRDLRASLKEVTDKTIKLRTEISMAQAAEKKRLIDLISQSKTTTDKLQRFIEKSERLLRLAKMCRKLETEQEKLPSSSASSLDAEQLSQEEACTSMEAPSEHPLVQEILDDSAALEKFWGRYSKVQLECLCLKKEKADLEQEKKQLELRIKEKQLEELPRL